ncbi:hypothetical protein H0H87_002058 [Tephrocybe sp. NHM501043]|nr:hypothetical protein H0H87_002058 [Tephrocybe sp. NHM501043]
MLTTDALHQSAMADELSAPLQHSHTPYLLTCAANSTSTLGHNARLDSAPGLRRNFMSTYMSNQRILTNNDNNPAAANVQQVPQPFAPPAPPQVPLDSGYVPMPLAALDLRKYVQPPPVVDKEALKKSRLHNNLKKLQELHRNGKAGLLEEHSRIITDFVTHPEDPDSPSIVARRLRLINHWSLYIEDFAPEIPQEAHWHAATVQRWAYGFLKFLVLVTPPLPNRLSIKSRTLTEWFVTFIQCIIRFTFDPTTNVACGMLLLTKQDLYTTLRAQLPQHPSYAKLGYYITLGDIKIIVEGPLLWHIQVNMRNFKGYNSVNGKQQIFRLTPVKHAHNILFDITTYLVLDLFNRKAFETKYETLEDLLIDQRAELAIDPTLKKDPLFLAVTNGGHKFVEPHAPAMAHSFAENISRWATAAGLPSTGVYALRRDVGDHYGSTLGSEFGKMLLAHSAQGVFRDSYSRNTENLDPVAHRFAKNTTGITSSGFDQRAYISAAVSAMTLLRHRKDKNESATHVLDKAETIQLNKAVDESPEMLQIQSHLEEAWNAYYDCFNVTARKYSPTRANIIHLQKLASSITKLKNPGNDPVAYIPGRETLAQDLSSVLEGVYRKKEAVQRKLRRVAKRTAVISHTELLKNSPLIGTVQERRDAVVLVNQTSDHVLNALAASREDATTTHTDIASTPSTSTAQPPVTSTCRPTLSTTSNTGDGTTIQPPFSSLDATSEIQQWIRDLQAHTASLDEAAHVDDLEELSINSSDFRRVEKDSSCTLPRLEDPCPPSTFYADQGDTDEPEISIEPQTAFADPEEGETDVLRIPVEAMRRTWIDYIMKPIYEEQDFKSYQNNCGEYECPKCKLFVNKPRESIHKTIGHLKRHLHEMHTEWHDLEIEMTDADGFHCPAGDYRAESLSDVWEHIESGECEKDKVFARMREAHDHHRSKINDVKIEQRRNILVNRHTRLQQVGYKETAPHQSKQSRSFDKDVREVQMVIDAVGIVYQKNRFPFADPINPNHSSRCQTIVWITTRYR